MYWNVPKDHRTIQQVILTTRPPHSGGWCSFPLCTVLSVQRYQFWSLWVLLQSPVHWNELIPSLFPMDHGDFGGSDDSMLIAHLLTGWSLLENPPLANVIYIQLSTQALGLHCVLVWRWETHLAPGPTALARQKGWGLSRPSHRPQLPVKGWGERGGAWGVSWLPSLSRGPVQSAVIEIDWMLFFLLQM